MIKVWFSSFLMKFKKLKFECAKSAPDSGDPKMKPSTRRQTKYVVLGGESLFISWLSEKLMERLDNNYRYSYTDAENSFLF